MLSSVKEMSSVQNADASLQNLPFLLECVIVLTEVVYHFDVSGEGSTSVRLVLM